MRFRLLPKGGRTVGCVCPQDAAAGAEAEIGVASVDSGVDCAFLASISGFPDGDHLHMSRGRG